MKTQFLQYLKNQLEQNQKLLAMNSISEEDKSMLQTAVDSLNETIAAVDAMEDSAEALDALKTTVEELQNSLIAVKEKINQESKKDENPTMENIENYLSSANAVKDFAQVVRNSKNGVEFHKNWEAMLSQNGVTIASGSEEFYLPEIVKGKIQDAWDRNSSWLADLKLLPGVKRYTIRKNDSNENDETSRAKGHKKGDTKVGQAIQLSGKLVTCQVIYKLIEISVQDEWDDETVVDYLVKELVDMILAEEKRAILVGDGRDVSSDYKITSMEAIAKNSTDAYTYVATETADGELIVDIVDLISNLHNPNDKPVYLFMSKTDINNLRKVKASSTSSTMFMGIEQIAEMIGVAKIIPTELLGTASGYRALAMIPSEYVLIGSNVLNPTLYSWHEGYKNINVHRYECFVGSAIEGLRSTAALKVNA